MYAGQQAVSSYGTKGRIPPNLSQSCSVTQIHIQQGSCPESHTLWQPVQFTLTVDRTAGRELDTRQCVSLCVSIHAYMQPQQRLLLHRRWVARESAAYEAKHFLHWERQGAQLNIKHFAVGRRQKRKWNVYVNAVMQTSNSKISKYLFHLFHTLLQTNFVTFVMIHCCSSVILTLFLLCFYLYTFIYAYIVHNSA